jgi:hypothetical protein
VSPYDFQITLPASLMNGFFTRLSLTEIVFPFVIPNINPKTNKIILRVEDTSVPPPYPITDYTITLSVGFYKPSEIAAELQSLIRTATGLAAFTITYGSDPAVLTNNIPIFEYSSGSGSKLVAFVPMTPLSGAWPYNNSTRQLFDLLGFSTINIPDWNPTTIYSIGQQVFYQSNIYASSVNNNLNNIPADPSAFWTPVVVSSYSNNIFQGNGFGGQTFAQGTRYVDIVCAQLSYNQALKDASSQKTVRDSLCRVYIVDPANFQSTLAPNDPDYCPPGCFPTIIYRNFAQPKQIQWLPNQPITGSLRFQVYDDEGDILTNQEFLSEGIVNRTNWSMTLLITEN